MTVVIVRHGSAGKRGGWSGSDLERPLDERGTRQAAHLPEALADVPVDRVLTSPATRCLETVEPLCASRSVPMEVDRALLEGSADQAVTLLRSLLDDDVVLCTHGDIIPVLLDHLARVEGVAFGPDPRWPEGSSWVVHREGRGLTEARFVPAPGAL